jgi:hypothetical protein
MYKQFRPLKRGEFFVIGADCSQGGNDYSACTFLSKSNLDFPLVYHSRGVAAQMTANIFPILEKIYDLTGVAPVVAFESNNGGSSEMERLATLNRLNKYRLYVMRSVGMVEQNPTSKYGYNTNTATRPILLGDWKQAIDGHLVNIYDKETIREHLSFIINPSGKAEAEVGAHDDLIFAHAIAWQLFQTETPLQQQTPTIPVNTFKGYTLE